ncbi:MAG: RsmE family RNA methyltransferase [Brevinematales bacterium]|nr:RsmE family RNA methyltransferase [Brevinematales bacterium]
MKIVFSSDNNIISGDKVIISDPKDYKHLKKVQRIKVSEEILFYDVEREIQFRCKVVDFSKDSIILRVLTGETMKRSKPEIIIIQALVQKGTFEDEINRLSELGVDILQPVISRHSQNFTFDDKYLSRLRRISYEGAKAVGNPFPLTILKPFSITRGYNDLEKFVRNFTSTDGVKTKLLLLTNRKIQDTSFDFIDIIPTMKDTDRIVFCVGSEGGFTEEEEDKIFSLGFVPVNLGSKILLRSDTVCIGLSFVFRLFKSSYQ